MTYQRGKIHYLDYIDHEGKRIREPHGTSKEAAETEEKRRKRMVMLLRGDAGQFGQIKWEDFKVLLEKSLYPKRAPGTVTAYKYFIKFVDKYIKPHKLIDVTPTAVENMRLKLIAEGTGKHSLERKIRAGFAIFTWAFKNDLIHEIKWHAVENTHLKNSDPVFLTIEEYKHVMNAWNPANQDRKNPIKHHNQLYTFGLMARRMIMRPAEVWFARWDLVDFNNSTYKLLDDEKVNFNVKVQSYRTLPIPPMLLEYLKDLKKKAKTEYIIEWPEGRIMKAERFYRHVSKALKNLGLKKAVAYSFRHTGASHMVVQNKETLNTTGKIMGHKSTNTTSIYVHPVTEDMRLAVEKLEQMEYAGQKQSCECGKDCNLCPSKDILISAVLTSNSIMNLTNKKDRP